MEGKFKGRIAKGKVAKRKANRKAGKSRQRSRLLKTNLHAVRMVGQHGQHAVRMVEL